MTPKREGTKTATYRFDPAARLDPCAGTAGYLRKPFDMAALIALVRPWLRESATQGAAH